MSKAARELSARERIRSQREADRRRDRRRRLVTVGAVAAVAFATIGGGWWYVQAGRSETPGGDLAPVTMQADGTVAMARPGVTKPVLDIYEDFQCPACQAFERASAATVKNLAAEGKVKVVYHPVTIFRDEPAGPNSMRASAAARCVPGGSQWVAFHDRLFKEQPPETASGFAAADLVKWGKEAGVTEPGFASCVTSMKNAQAQAAYTKKVIDAKLLTKGTPTVRLDGAELENRIAFSPAALRGAVLDAAKRAGTR
ncbi:thioredoxin domain-containing protein [Sphaerisporangium rubeum]|uniref:Protein-disulfide isomerase n=1 Tax=Sphaerisporangium rubeum TaxID=321317 RepID=A0A7X0IG11_9ACTN|nr:thioredoxin domain-containing protein [Sphaerisporangium rubeum]MBB6474472.1 protein-disulfide isomerase [Sphaerisporangium rubeum]